MCLTLTSLSKFSTSNRFLHKDQSGSERHPCPSSPPSLEILVSWTFAVPPWHHFLFIDCFWIQFQNANQIPCSAFSFLYPLRLQLILNVSAPCLQRQILQPLDRLWRRRVISFQEVMALSLSQSPPSILANPKRCFLGRGREILSRYKAKPNLTRSSLSIVQNNTCWSVLENSTSEQHIAELQWELSKWV